MRDYKGLKDVDVKLILLSGSSITVDNIEIIPYTIEEIKNYGYSNYMQGLQLLSLTVEDFLDSVKDVEKRMILEVEKQNLRAFDFYSKLAGEDFKNILLVALSVLLRTDDIRFLDDNVLAIDFMKMGILYEDKYGMVHVDNEKLENISEDQLKLIHRENFDSIVEVIKMQNYLMKVSEKEDDEFKNPADEATRLLAEQIKKNRERVKAKKKLQNDDDEDDIDISDIISAVCSKSNSINKLNVWDFTLYQVYDEYARLELIDSYDFSIRAMMAGAEKVDLKHWSSKIT
ncbi:putative tail assembly chaperone [Bacillus phage Kirov]|uniref:Putative tail assembly chaperone n=1 Tax=Bacillus phage Kirov TaxID=2783539 RepID=A0A7S6RB19_9CAUD|nr:putative tail assembly chaperone [Bacillus phage Kirov]QOV08241.1 putative tail assembly chaperone [Bacillus phage Kirov]